MERLPILNKMKRIIRDRHLTPEEAAKYKKEREKDDPNYCDTCGAILYDGHIAGNHVRGDKDQFCDKCYRLHNN